MKTVGEMSFAVVGTGLVGLGWGVVFAQAAGEVRLYDLDPSRAVNARDQIVRILERASSTIVGKFDLGQAAPGKYDVDASAVLTEMRANER